MSTKLNASELAREQFPMPYDASPYKHAEVSILREGYIAAINTKAQPIADERDEYREALERIANTDPDEGTSWFHHVANAILAKYPQP
jgi:hypothetical protein